MKLCPAEAVDYDQIRQTVVELGERYTIGEIAVDHWNATQITTQLSHDGFEIVVFGQGIANMNSPTKKLEELVLARTLAHGGNPVLRWMAGSLSVEKDAADNWKVWFHLEFLKKMASYLGRVLLTAHS